MICFFKCKTHVALGCEFISVEKLCHVRWIPNFLHVLICECVPGYFTHHNLLNYREEITVHCQDMQ